MRTAIPATRLASVAMLAVAMTTAIPAWAGTAAGAGRPRAEGVMDSGRLADALDRLSNATRVLYVAAHPDDENTRLLSSLANGRHVTAAYLSLTRGGGGQNLIGTEQGELLDVIRTEELLAARRIDGARQWFTRARDFGYSKTPREALAIWNHDDVLSDVVRVIRSFQPDVIITRFNEVQPNHGHHTASYLLAGEAFTAAADPTRFPDQLKQGVTTWQAKRLLYNVSHWRGDPPPEAFPVDIGGWSPRLGLGYGEIAALSRSQHKSQGFGASGERGELVENFLHLAGDETRTDLLDGIAPGWSRYGAAAEPWSAALEEARRALDRDLPERAIPALTRAYRALDALPDDVRTREARQSLEHILLSASGLFIRATSPAHSAVPGATATVDVELVMQRPVTVRLEGVSIPGEKSGVSQTSAPPKVVAIKTSDVATPSVAQELKPNAKVVVNRDVTIPEDAPISSPYWLAEPPTAGRFGTPDPKLTGLPHGPPAIAATVDVNVGGVRISVEAPVVHSWTDRVHGERVRPFLIVPPATVTPLRQATLLVNGRPSEVLLRVRAGRDGVKGDVSLDLPKGWTATPPVQSVDLARAGAETTVRFEVRAPSSAQAPIEAKPVVSVDGRRWTFREDVIDHPHIPVQTVLQPASLRLSPVQATLPKGLVGYVRGPGDTVAEDLAHLGVRIEPVTDEQLLSGDFSRYQAIIVGIRAYNTRETLRAAHERLMRWVQRGGTVVVQYNTHTWWDPLDTPIGPYPLELGRLARITDETAEIVPVKATHKLLQSPHRIGPADFEGWVQERGIYFGEKWDDRYEPLFRMADPDEEAMLGGVLFTQYGKGRYVYTGLAFFRQLPAGVPGAYRLLLNFIGGK